MIRKNCPRSVARLLGLFIVILALGVSASAEWKEKVLYSFQGGSSDGSVPAGGVVFDKKGNLYGADTSGGSGGCADQGCGMVFQVSPPTEKGRSVDRNINLCVPRRYEWRNRWFHASRWTDH
jgi:hypothetical protein